MQNNIRILESELNMPVMKLPVKTVVIGIGEKVVMISPFPKIQQYQKQIEEIGIPTDIVAPNGFHHLGINRAARMYPQAKLWGVEALKTKRQDINWHGILPYDWPYGDELEAIFIEGIPKIDEVLFFHRPSKSLIITDLCFNHVKGKGFGNWLIFNMFGTYKRFAVSRFFAKFVKSKEKFRHSIQRVWDLDIDKIIIAHGENVEINAKEKLQQALKERRLI